MLTLGLKIHHLNISLFLYQFAYLQIEYWKKFFDILGKVVRRVSNPAILRERSHDFIHAIIWWSGRLWSGNKLQLNSSNFFKAIKGTW